MVWENSIISEVANTYGGKRVFFPFYILRKEKHTKLIKIQRIKLNNRQKVIRIKINQYTMEVKSNKNKIFLLKYLKMVLSQNCPHRFL